MVSAGGSDFERAAAALLSANVAEVGYRRGLAGRCRRRMGGGWVTAALEVRNRLGQVSHRHGLDAGQRDLRPGLGRADDPLESRLPGALCGDERTRNGPEAAVEGELADRRVTAERAGRELVRGGEHRQRDRQVEARALLAEPCRGEVDGQARPARPLELGRSDAAADTVLRLLAGAVGEADDRECGCAALEVRLDLDPARIQADERVGDRASEHVATIGDNMCRVCAESVERVRR